MFAGLNIGETFEGFRSLGKIPDITGALKIRVSDSEIKSAHTLSYLAATLSKPVALDLFHLVIRLSI